uniref:uncharacterized protein n=1 Tax=Myxine glutinosa TaxID=7769 RepID=UPI00358DF654
MESKGFAQMMGCPFNIKSQLKYDGKSFEMDIESICNSLQLNAAVKHSIPQLLKTGLPEETRLNIAADGNNRQGSFDFQAGKCTFKVMGNLHPGSHAKWLLQMENVCQPLQHLGVPRSIKSHGSATTSGCNINLKSHFTFNGKFVILKLETICSSFKLKSSLKHSMPELTNAGLPENSILIVTADWKNDYHSSAKLKAGQCDLQLIGNLQLDSQIKWWLRAKNKCVFLQEAGVPHSLESKGDAKVHGCTIDFKSYVKFDEKSIHMNMNMVCKSFQLYASLQHSIPQLSKIGLPESSNLTIFADWKVGYEGLAKLQMGRCELKFSGKLLPGQETKWLIRAHNKCQPLKEIGFPSLIESVGNATISGCTTNLKSILKFDKKSAQLKMETICESFKLKMALKNSIPQLISLGLPKQSTLNMAIDWKNDFDGFAEINAGDCTFKISGRNNNLRSGRSQWNIILDHNCSLLKTWNVPLQMKTRGHVLLSWCPVDILVILTWDDKSMDWNLNTVCNSFSIEMSFQHSVEQLYEAGIPDRNFLNITVYEGAEYRMSTRALTGQCHIQLLGTFRPKNKTNWELSAQHTCLTLMNKKIPKFMMTSGSLVQKDCANQLRMDAKIDENSVTVEIKTMCKPKLKLTINLFYHSLASRVARSPVEAYPNCQIYLNAQLKPELTSEWEASLVNSCPQLQGLWIPNKVEIQGQTEFKPNLFFTNVNSTIDGTQIDSTISYKLHQVNEEVGGAWDSFEALIFLSVNHSKMFKCQLKSQIQPNISIIFINQHNLKALNKVGYPHSITITMEAKKQGRRWIGGLDVNADRKQLRMEIEGLSSFKSVSLEFIIAAQHNIPTMNKLQVPKDMKMYFHLTQRGWEVDGKLQIEYNPNNNVELLVRGQPGHKRVSRDAMQSNPALVLLLAFKQNIPSLLKLLPADTDFKIEVNYSPVAASSDIKWSMDKKHLNAFTKYELKNNTFEEVVMITNSFPWLKVIPKSIEVSTLAARHGGEYSFNHTMELDSQRVTVQGFYSGKLPKLRGSHTLRVFVHQPMFKTFPKSAGFYAFLNHSSNHHQSEITISLNEQDQIVLRFYTRNKWLNHIGELFLQQPFTPLMNTLSVETSLLRSVKKFVTKAKVSWDENPAVHFNASLLQKHSLKRDVAPESWQGCLHFIFGELQTFMEMEHLHVCGTLYLDENSMHESLKLHWNQKLMSQRVHFKKRIHRYMDTMDLTASLEHPFEAPCQKVKVRGKLNLNYKDMVKHTIDIHGCDLTTPLKITSFHRYNKKNVIISSTTRVNYTGNKEKDVILSFALKNGGQQKRDYSLDLAAFQNSSVTALQWKGTYAVNHCVGSLASGFDDLTLGEELNWILSGTKESCKHSLRNQIYSPTMGAMFLLGKYHGDRTMDKITLETMMDDQDWAKILFEYKN